MIDSAKKKENYSQRYSAVLLQMQVSLVHRGRLCDDIFLCVVAIWHAAPLRHHADAPFQ